VPSFPFRFDPRFTLMLRLGGITPATSVVEINDEAFEARFGRWAVETPTANLARFEVTGDYRWYRAIGVRSSLADRGLTFGSNARAGVCVCFHQPVSSNGPLLFTVHTAVTVTVADVDGFAGALLGYGVPG
jgi:hypothetical protein